MANCERCYKETLVTIGSMFNTQIICPDCADAERAHPQYEEARRVESEEVRTGNFNFAGIGLPAELMKRAPDERIFFESTEDKNAARDKALGVDK